MKRGQLKRYPKLRERMLRERAECISREISARAFYYRRQIGMSGICEEHVEARFSVEVCAQIIERELAKMEENL